RIGHQKLAVRTWQIDADACTDAQRTVDRDETSRLLGKTVDLAEPKARTVTNALGGKEGLEDTVDDFLWHARAGVGHIDHDVIASLDLSGHMRARVHLLEPRR